MKTIGLLFLACFTLALPVCAHPVEDTYTVKRNIAFGGHLLHDIIALDDFKKCEHSGWPPTPFCEGVALGLAKGISDYRKELE